MATPTSEWPASFVWPEMEEFCLLNPLQPDTSSEKTPFFIGVDLAERDSFTAISISNDRIVDVFVMKTAVQLGRVFTGDVEAMIDDIDRVEMTPRTSLEVVSDRIERLIAKNISSLFWRTF